MLSATQTTSGAIEMALAYSRDPAKQLLHQAAQMATITPPGPKRDRLLRLYLKALQQTLKAETNPETTNKETNR